MRSVSGARKSAESGFSLIEMLVVLAVISAALIYVGAALPSPAASDPSAMEIRRFVQHLRTTAMRTASAVVFKVSQRAIEGEGTEIRWERLGTRLYVNGQLAGTAETIIVYPDGTFSDELGVVANDQPLVVLTPLLAT